MRPPLPPTRPPARCATQEQDQALDEIAIHVGRIKNTGQIMQEELAEHVGDAPPPPPNKEPHAFLPNLLLHLPPPPLPVSFAGAMLCALGATNPPLARQ